MPVLKTTRKNVVITKIPKSVFGATIFEVRKKKGGKLVKSIDTTSLKQAKRISKNI